MLASGRLSASTVPAYCGSINRPGFASPTPSSSARCARQPVTHTPIPPRKATGRSLDPTSSNLTSRPNPHRARGTDRAPTFRDFVPWRFSDAGRPSMWRLRHCRRPKTCTKADIRLGSLADRKFAGINRRDQPARRGSKSRCTNEEISVDHLLEVDESGSCLFSCQSRSTPKPLQPQRARSNVRYRFCTQD